MKVYAMRLIWSYVGWTAVLLTLLYSSPSIKNHQYQPLCPCCFPFTTPHSSEVHMHSASLLSKQAGSLVSLGRRYSSEEVCVSFSLVVSYCYSTKIFGGCVLHFKLKSSFYKDVPFPLIFKSVRGKHWSKWNSKQNQEWKMKI